MPSIPPLPVRKTSGLAITSLVLGCFSFFLSCLTGIPAVICGILALREIGRKTGLEGQGQAIAGIILGGFSMLILPMLAGLAIPAISGALDAAKQTKEVADIRMVGIALYAYATEHDGKYPDSLETLAQGKDIDETQLYKKDSRELRWVLTPGLSTADDENTILLQSADTMGKGKKKGRAVYRVGNTAQWLREAP